MHQYTLVLNGDTISCNFYYFFYNFIEQCYFKLCSQKLINKSIQQGRINTPKTTKMPTSKKEKTPPPASVQNFPVVGIGASAGGLDAFKRLLTAIPENSGMAYVLVQHLDPTHESILPEILQRATKIPVHEITDDIKLAPDHIYIIPSNKILTSTDGVLQLAPRDKKIINLTIDVFFNSLAEVHKEFAIGIVLSGTGSDGTRGLRAIKEHGGITLAQDAMSATFDSMPQNAIDAGVVDFILQPEDMPAQLLQIVSTYKANHVFKEEVELPKDDDSVFKQKCLTSVGSNTFFNTNALVPLGVTYFLQ